jgi:hypothetical protein
VNQFYRRKPRTNIWPDVGSRFAPVKLVHRSGDLSKNAHKNATKKNTKNAKNDISVVTDMLPCRGEIWEVRDSVVYWYSIQ